MIKILQEIGGDHTIEVWIAAFFWSLIGIIGIKLWAYKKRNKFNFKFWINDNSRDILLGILLSMVILRLGDYLIYIINNNTSFKIPETEDFIAMMIVISAYVQYKLHKSRLPISNRIKDEMNEYNKKVN
jgi:hypothetical protein